jgi:hypothetical protein
MKKLGSIPRTISFSSVFGLMLWLIIGNTPGGSVAGQGGNNPVAVISAASFTTDLAPAAIAAVFGANLAVRMRWRRRSRCLPNSRARA